MHAATRPWPTALALSLAIAVALLGAGCNKRADSQASSGQLMRDESAVAADAPAGAPESAPAREEMEAKAGGQGVQGLANHNGSQLAYQHDVRVLLQAQRIADNLSKVREACTSQKFGACDVLGEQLTAGDIPTGTLEIRAAPVAIGGLVQTAAEGGEVSQRSTQAEDLADAVRDNGLRRKRLELQHAKLSEIMERRDIKVDELMSLTERMAMLEAELNGAEQEAAQQQRRIATNRLTLHFDSENVTVATEASTRIGEAFRGLTTIWDNAIAWMITVFVGGLLPFALVLGSAAWVVVKVVRKLSRPKAAPAR